ncbi:hypothetical protein AB3S75_046644 [Citrus x aurantiifolia]
MRELTGSSSSSSVRSTVKSSRRLGSVRKSATESNGSEIGREKENNLKTSIACHQTRRKSTSSLSNYARSKRQGKRGSAREDVRDIVDDDEEEEDEGNNHHRDPKWQHEPCLKQCERRESGEQQQQQQCKSWCKKHRQKEQRRREKEGKFSPSSNWLGSEEEEENNPYYFHSQRFRYRLRSDSGHITDWPFSRQIPAP